MLFSLNNTPKLIIKISNTIIKKTNYAFFIKNNKDEYFFILQSATGSSIMEIKWNGQDALIIDQQVSLKHDCIQ